MVQEIAFTSPDREFKTVDLTWKDLYKIGGTAAFMCAVMYLITLAVYVPANLTSPPPETVLQWFATFEESPVTALFFLGMADVIIMVLWGPMSLALYILLRRSNKTWMLLATPFVFVGMAVFLASNPALSMLSLSQEYASALTETDRTMLLAAGQAMLAISRGIGILYTGMPLVWLAGVIFSIVMLRSGVFSKAASWVGIVGFGLLVLGVPFGGHYTATGTPTALQSAMVASQYVGGGLLSMVWYCLVGIKLLRLGFGVEAMRERAAEEG